MSYKRILIVFGSRFGSTEEISIQMSKIFKEKGIGTEVVNLRVVKESEWPYFANFDGLLIGTGIRIGKWTKEVKNFVVKNKDRINAFKRPVGFFISSGVASFPETYDQAKNDFIVEPFEDIGVRISYFDAFGGVIDLSKSSNKGWLDKKILRKIFKNNPKIDLNAKNDFRDWKRIEDFSNEFCELLES
ncbi:MAG: flavodoxin domain-containing protein [Candidatus Hodarchaeales archaeon]